MQSTETQILNLVLNIITLVVILAREWLRRREE